MGAVQIASHSMVQSIEENSVRKGFDPRDFALVAEGGAGPAVRGAHRAWRSAPPVVVPPYPGVTAALGLLATDKVYEYVTTTYQRLSHARRRGARGAVRRARGAGAAAARGGRHPGRPARHPARRGLPLPRPGLRAAHRRAGRRDRRRVGRERRARFHDAHEREYSRRFEDSDIEIPNIRVRGVGLMPLLRAAGGREGRRVAGGGAAPRARGLVPRRGRAAQGRDALLRPRRR